MKFFNLDSPLTRILNKFADLVILNVIFLICCIPIITIGPALTGLSYVTLKMAEGEEGYIIRGFFKSFRQNFKQGFLLWLIMLIIGLVLGLDFYIVKGESGIFHTAMRLFLILTAVIYFMVFSYLFAVLSRFYNRTHITLRNAFFMSIADLPRTLVIMVLMVGSVVLTFFNGNTLTYGFLFWPLIGFSLIGYLNGYFLKKVFTKYTPDQETESYSEICTITEE